MSKPTANRVLAVRTPGTTEVREPVKPTAEQLQQMKDEAEALERSLLEDDPAGSGTDTGAESSVIDAATDPAPAASAGLTAPDIQRMIDEGIARGVAQALATRARASAGPNEQELPDQSEVDPATITKEVLTKQGWVVPHEFPGQRDPRGSNLQH